MHVSQETQLFAKFKVQNHYIERMKEMLRTELHLLVSPAIPVVDDRGQWNLRGLQHMSNGVRKKNSASSPYGIDTR